MIQINCQSSIKITGTKTIYFDPIKVEEKHDADYIFITHPHWDHFSKEDILKIKKENTVIIGPVDIEKELDFSKEYIILLTPNEILTIDDLTIKTVPAYNVNKEYHKKENNWLGYIVDFENIKYYIPGDTDALEENKDIECDIAFIPIGGTYTMAAKEAANFINCIKPKKVIPIHYNMVVGTKKDEQDFINNIDSNIEVEIYIKEKSVDSLVIEKLVKKDLREAISIYDLNHNLTTNYEKLYQEYDKIRINSDYLNLVAKIDGKIVGFATVVINHDIVEELRPFLTVWNLGVHKDYRRMGVGTKLLEYIYEYGKGLDCTFIALLAEKDNTDAQQFYESLKFERAVGYLKIITK